MLREQEQLSVATRATVKTLLVVEDDPDNREFFNLALSSLTPYHVLSAKKASEALNFVRHIKPNLLLLGYHLPDMSGIELYDLLHVLEGMENVPAIIFSSVLRDEVRQEILNRKLVMLDKPFDLDVFLDTIKQMLM
jgi:CheY-like chemotaxis protein